MYRLVAFNAKKMMTKINYGLFVAGYVGLYWCLAVIVSAVRWISDVFSAYSKAWQLMNYQLVIRDIRTPSLIPKYRKITSKMCTFMCWSVCRFIHKCYVYVVYIGLEPMNCVSFSPSPNIWVVTHILRSKEYMPQVLWENDNCTSYIQDFIAAMVIAL